MSDALKQYSELKSVAAEIASAITARIADDNRSINVTININIGLSNGGCATVNFGDDKTHLTERG